MGTQVPDWPVRFDVRVGRRILYDPAYNALGLVARAAWFESNLVATEFDGIFPESAIHDRFLLWPSVGVSWCVDTNPTADHSEHDCFEVWWGVLLDSLIPQLWADDVPKSDTDDHRWLRIVGWEKYQPDPLERPSSNGKMYRSNAEKQAAYRARKKTPVTGVTGVTGVTRPLPAVTPRVRASVSVSSSLSEIPSRKSASERHDVSMPTPLADAMPGNLKAKLAEYGYHPVAAPTVEETTTEGLTVDEPLV